jgi:cytochrome c-type biogenesis protein CcmH/NrfG
MSKRGNDLNDEIEQLRIEVRSHPDNLDVWKRLGQRMQDNSDYDDAMNAFNQALEIEPDNDEVRKRLDACKRERDFYSFFRMT